ncbi:MAG TPA: hypothetical protein VIQ31_26075 [Phormidium sp.]
MTFQTAKIQALIAEIDAVLSKDSKSRFGWLVGEGNCDRQMLERVRQQLQKWQEQLIIQQGTGAQTQVAEIASYQILFEQTDAEATEISHINDFALLMESFQGEIALLQQQRQALLNEIQQLQQKRQALINPETSVQQQQIITEFSQALISRLQETVNQQVAETLEKIQAVQLPEENTQTSLRQEIELQRPEFIGLELTAINPPLEFIIAPVQPLPYAGVELSKGISETQQKSDFITSQIEQNDTISALTDLIENVAETTASPEEDLLTTELSASKPKVDLWLGNNIVEQLNEDLSDLEGVEQTDIQTPEDIIKTTNEATDSIDSDLAAAVEQEKFNAAIPEHILAEFEDLFGDANNSSIKSDSAELETEETSESVTNQEPVELEKKN